MSRHARLERLPSVKVVDCDGIVSKLTTVVVVIVSRVVAPVDIAVVVTGLPNVVALLA